MPHIIVEYSNDLETQINMPALLQKLHASLAEQGIDEGRIKTRGIRLEHAVVGERDSEKMMAHITLLLLEGRDTQTKQSYGQALHAIVQETVHELQGPCAVTLEVRDMVKDTYIL